jgi:hypothetical protein
MRALKVSLSLPMGSCGSSHACAVQSCWDGTREAARQGGSAGRARRRQEKGRKREQVSHLDAASNGALPHCLVRQQPVVAGGRGRRRRRTQLSLLGCLGRQILRLLHCPPLDVLHHLMGARRQEGAEGCLRGQLLRRLVVAGVVSIIGGAHARVSCGTGWQYIGGGMSGLGILRCFNQ